MRVDVLTTFPEIFGPVLDASIVGRAREAGVVTVEVHDLRRWTTDRHHTTDDAPFGGGPGMVMKPDPFFAGVAGLRCAPEEGCREEVVLLCPQGERFEQGVARELAGTDHLILLCGHYEGVDERVREHLATRALSIGDYVLTGGELPAMVVIDAVVRLLPGALGAEEGAAADSFALFASLRENVLVRGWVFFAGVVLVLRGARGGLGGAVVYSFAEGLLEYPQYTRPAEFRGWAVPEILLSGHHEQIRRWRRKESLRRTRQLRPELLEGVELTEEDRELLEEVEEEEALGEDG